MPKIEIITSIVGSKDAIREQPKSEAKYICYTDDLTMKTKTWELRPAYDRFTDPRRNSRIHKILIHKYSEADITMWIDGNIRLLKSPEEIIAEYLRPTDDMVQFLHGLRDCIYDESMVVAKLKLDDPEVIIEQAKYYEDHGYGKHKGLNAGYFIIRRNNKRTRALNDAWWADYCRFSRRDQLSLMPAIDKIGVQIHRIPEAWIIGENGGTTMGGITEIVSHAHKEGNFDNPNKNE